MLSVLFILHFLADFLLQTPQMGREKSEKFKVLLLHCNIHFLVFLFGLIVIGLGPAILFALTNAFIHGIIDWYVWRLYKKSVVERNPGVDLEILKKTFKYWEDPIFIKTIGFDQLLHILTLYGLWQFFTHFLI